MSAEARAAELERMITSAIELGEFTPQHTYFRIDTRLGPCGCAVAAAVYVTKPISEAVKYGEYEWMRLRNDLINSENDLCALRDGYENYGGHTSEPFFELGHRLRRFHPFKAEEPRMAQ